MRFVAGDEVKIKDDLEPRLGVIAGNPGRVVRTTHSGAVVHVYIYPWKRIYVYGASDLAHREGVAS